MFVATLAVYLSLPYNLATFTDEFLAPDATYGSFFLIAIITLHSALPKWFWSAETNALAILGNL